MTTTSGTIKRQPGKLTTETIKDPATRANFEAANRTFQELEQLAKGRNFFVSDPVTSLMASNGPVLGLGTTFQTQGRPVIAALMPGEWGKYVSPTGSLIALPPSSYQLQPAPATTPTEIDAAFSLHRDGVQVFRSSIGVGFPSGALSNIMRLPPFLLLGFDVIPAGKYRYALGVEGLSVNSNLLLSHVSLLLLEW